MGKIRQYIVINNKLIKLPYFFHSFGAKTFQLKLHNFMVMKGGKCYLCKIYRILNHINQKLYIVYLELTKKD